MKPKRSKGFDEKPGTSGGDDIDLRTGDEYEDDDIIDLEDIIEMPARSIDEDEDIDMDVEILDAEPGLDFDTPEKPGKAASPPSFEKDDLGFAIEETRDEEDLLRDFDPDDEEDLFEKLALDEGEKKQAAKDEPIFGDEDDLLLENFMDEVETPLPTHSEENQQGLRERAAAALKIDDETAQAPEPEPSAPEVEHSVSAIEAPVAAAAAVAVQATPQSASPPGAGDESMVAELVEELVGRIESRLFETVRQVVEARLPEIAREVIREEIERVKKEIDL